MIISVSVQSVYHGRFFDREPLRAIALGTAEYGRRFTGTHLVIQYSAMRTSSRGTLGLWVGDFITVVILTLVGFASHDQLAAGISRMVTTFLPVLFAWVFTAAPAGVMTAEAAAQPRSLWRVAWAMILAGALASILRGLMLNQPILPVFAVVLSGSALIAIMVWRTIFMFWIRRVK